MGKAHFNNRRACGYAGSAESILVKGILDSQTMAAEKRFLLPGGL